jgi:chromosome partitioning protein
MDLMGIAEIAVMAGVSRQTVANWRARDAAFPTAVAELAAGPVFQVPEIRRYLRMANRNVSQLARLVPFAALRSAMGRTTLLVGMAEALAGQHRSRVLVVDLDPQGAASSLLLGGRRWIAAMEAGRTVAATLLSDDGRRLQDCTYPAAAAALETAGYLDVLPSSVELHTVEQAMMGKSAFSSYGCHPLDALRRGLSPFMDEYGWVLIDCPSGLGALTLNALNVCEGYVIVTSPDPIGTYGIEMITSAASRLASGSTTPIEALGMAVTGYRPGHRAHSRHVARLKRDGSYPHVFNTLVPEASELRGIHHEKEGLPLLERWGQQQGYPALRRLADELTELLSSRRTILRA